MLSSALIDCLTVQLNVELCSDSLFHSGLISLARMKETQGGKNIYISILSSPCYIIGKVYCIYGFLEVWDQHTSPLVT